MENVAEIKEQFRNLIRSKSGMMITDVHFRQLEKYLDETVANKNISYSDLYASILTNQNELIDLINAVVVNETYFFREEKQFQFLREYIKQNFSGKNVVLWSAACSTGEEAYSLASLATGCNANPIVYATDIDTDALMRLKSGIYGQNSFRPDGNSFMNYMEPYLSCATDEIGQKIYAVSPNLKEKITCGRANLLDLDSSKYVPQNETVDIIFIRNVFIYFDNETRNAILRDLVKRLKKGGLLFFSISEIAGIFPEEAGVPLVKNSTNYIYYFVKEDAKDRDSRFNELKKKLDDKKNQASKDELWTRLKKEASEKKEAKSNVSLTKDITIEKKEVPENKTKANYASPNEFWEIYSELIDKKEFSAAEEILSTFNPSVNLSYLKYYFGGVLYAAQNEKKQAISYYEKASISNPHFWPACYQIAFLLMTPADLSEKKIRYNALLKAASIIEENKEESELYTWLLGSFSSSYFYKLCNDYLKKGVDLDVR